MRRGTAYRHDLPTQPLPVGLGRTSRQPRTEPRGMYASRLANGGSCRIYRRATRLRSLRIAQERRHGSITEMEHQATSATPTGGVVSAAVGEPLSCRYLKYSLRLFAAAGDVEDKQ